MYSSYVLVDPDRQQTMMENELQRMVREMEEKYRAQAFEALDQESKNAIVAKGQLELKFLRQNETVQSMNERFEQLDLLQCLNWE